MKDMILGIFFNTQDPQLFPFQCGYITGVVLSVAVLIILYLLWLILRGPKKASGLRLDTPHGDLFISAGAICDLAKAAGDAFGTMRIDRVTLYFRKKAFVLKVVVTYLSGSEGSMRDTAGTYQEEVIRLLKTRFGIENIEQINLCVRKSRSK